MIGTVQNDSPNLVGFIKSSINLSGTIKSSVNLSGSIYSTGNLVGKLSKPAKYYEVDNAQGGQTAIIGG